MFGAVIPISPLRQDGINLAVLRILLRGDGEVTVVAIDPIRHPHEFAQLTELDWATADVFVNRGAAIPKCLHNVLAKRLARCEELDRVTIGYGRPLGGSLGRGNRKERQ